MKKQVLTRVMLVIASVVLLVITCNMWEAQMINKVITYLLLMIGVLTMEGCLTTPFNIEKSWRYKRWNKAN